MPADPASVMTVVDRDAWPGGYVLAREPDGRWCGVFVGRASLLKLIADAREPGADLAAALRDAVAGALAANLGLPPGPELGGEDLAMFVHQAAGRADPAAAFADLLARYRRLAERRA